MKGKWHRPYGLTELHWFCFGVPDYEIDRTSVATITKQNKFWLLCENQMCISGLSA
jgi:hypothetical protein